MTNSTAISLYLIDVINSTENELKQEELLNPQFRELRKESESELALALKQDKKY